MNARRTKMLTTRPLTSELGREHRSMAMATFALHKAAQDLYKDAEAAVRTASRCLRVLVDLGDRYHHGKEERAIIPALWADASLRADEELDEILEDHRRCRDLLSQMEATLPSCVAHKKARDDFARLVEAYKAIAYYHMRRESSWLFPLVEKRLALQGPIIQRRLRALEATFGGSDKHRRLTEEARELRHEAVLIPAGRH